MKIDGVQMLRIDRHLRENLEQGLAEIRKDWLTEWNPPADDPFGQMAREPVVPDHKRDDAVGETRDKR